MEKLWFAASVVVFWVVAGGALRAQTKSPPIDLDALMSQPVATELAAAPVGHRFAWVEDAASRRNVWVGGPGETAHNLTGYTADDGLKTGELAWSPDGKLIAYVRSTPYGTDGRAANPAHNAEPNDPTVWLTGSNAEAGVLARVGLGHAPKFLPDGRLLFLRGGAIWVAELTFGLANSVSAHPLIEGITYGSASALTLSPEGKQLAFLSSRDRGLKQLAIYDLEKKTLRWSPGFGRVVRPGWSPDGREIACYRAPADPAEFATNRVSSHPWTLEVLNVATGQTRTVYRPEANQPGSVLALPDNNDPSLAWMADGRIEFFTEEGGWIHLRAANADGSPMQEETVRPGEVDRMALSPDRTRLLLADSYDLPPLCAGRPRSAVRCMAMRRSDATAIDQRHVEVADPVAATPPQRLRDGEGTTSVAGVAWSSDGLYRAALVSDPRRPMHPVVWAEDDSMTDLHPLADPPGLPRASLAAPRQAIFPGSPTTGEPGELHGQLFLPTGGAAGKRPAVIYFHGGPRRQMQLAYPSSAYYSGDYAFNQYLVSLGFVVLSVNYRGGLGYGLDFRQCEGCGAAGAAEYADVLAAQKYLASRPDVDARRIGLWGGSYGGYLTALGLAWNSDLFAAGVDFSGVHEWILERNRGDWLIGSPAQKQLIAARAHASSPMAAIDRWRSPVLLIHGDQDPDVNFAQTTTLAAALRARHVPVETLLLPGETHNFLLHRDWMASFMAAAKFLTSTLHPEP